MRKTIIHPFQMPAIVLQQENESLTKQHEAEDISAIKMLYQNTLARLLPFHNALTFSSALRQLDQTYKQLRQSVQTLKQNIDAFDFEKAKKQNEVCCELRAKFLEQKLLLSTNHPTTPSTLSQSLNQIRETVAQFDERLKALGRKRTPSLQAQFEISLHAFNHEYGATVENELIQLSLRLNRLTQSNKQQFFASSDHGNSGSSDDEDKLEASVSSASTYS